MMRSHIRSAGGLLRLILQTLSFLTLIVLVIGALGYTAACALGYAPWLDLPLTFGETVYLQAGLYIQCGLGAFLLGLCFFLPTNQRIMQLEASHRNFHIGMKDVARAYAAAHRADREGVFQLKGEFDSIRERIAFLRDHPDLADLEPSVLELAAQMSQVSQELAQTYSDSAVARARDFLMARQQEIETFNERIEGAKAMAQEIRQWADQVDMEEAVARAQLDRLRDQLAEVLPELLPELLPDSRPPAEAPQPADATDAPDPQPVAQPFGRLTLLEPRAAE